MAVCQLTLQSDVPRIFDLISDISVTVQKESLLMHRHLEIQYWLSRAECESNIDGKRGGENNRKLRGHME